MKKNGKIYLLDREEIDDLVLKAGNIFLSNIKQKPVTSYKELWTHPEFEEMPSQIMKEIHYQTSTRSIKELEQKDDTGLKTTLYVLCAYVLYNLEKIDLATIKALKKRGKNTPYIGKNIPEGHVNLVSEYVHYLMEKAIVNHPSRNDHLFELKRWNHNDPLITEKSIVRENHDGAMFFFTKEQQHFYETEVTRLIEKYGDSNGALYYLVGFTEAYNKMGTDNVFKFHLAKNWYAEKIAVEYTMIKYPSIRKNIETFLDDNGEREYLKNSLPTATILNVTVLDESGTKFLGIQRSGSTDLEKYSWIVGVYETMLRHHETIIGCAKNALNHELGLDEDDYSPFVFTYMGIVLTRMTVNIKAVVRLNIPHELLVEKWKNAKDYKEAKAIEWFPFDRESIYQLLKGKDNKDALLYQELQKAGHKTGKRNSEWFFQAPSTLAQAWRMRDLIK